MYAVILVPHIFFCILLREDRCVQVQAMNLCSKESRVPGLSQLYLDNTKDGASLVALMIRKTPANAGDVRDMGSIPGLGRSPGGGHGNPFQYSCLENAMGSRAWQAMVHRITQSQT